MNPDTLNKAMLSADYLDAGANRVVAVLEKLRDGLIARRAQVIKYRDEAKATGDKQAADEFYAMQDAYRAAIDDVCIFIQREQVK